MRPFCGTEAECEHCRKDYGAGKQRHEDDEYYHLQRRAGDILVLRHISSIRDEYSKANGQGEETESHGFEYYVRSNLGEIRMEEEVQPCGSTIHKHHMDCHHYQHDEQNGHENLAQTLNALVDVKPQYRCRENNSYDGIEYHSRGISLKGLEVSCKSSGIHT